MATEAILLVGGLGTRLRPLTERTPKPMLPVAGVPFVAHQLARLRDCGVTHVVLATSYRAEVFEGYFGAGAAFGIDLEYVTEDAPLGTGGAIRNAAARLRSAAGDPVVVLNGDILSGHDLPAQLARHSAARAAVTLHLTRVADARPYGCVPTDDAGRVLAFLEKVPAPVTDQINAGCYVFQREVIDGIPPDQVVSVEREVFPVLVASGAVVLGVVDDAYWLDVGTPAAYVRASSDLVLGRLASRLVPGHQQALVLAGAQVDATAVVSGGTTVGGRASVGGGAHLEGSVLMDGAVVGPRTRVVSSAVGVGAYVGADCLIEGVVVADGAVVGAGSRLGAGVRVGVEEQVPEGSVRTADHG